VKIPKNKKIQNLALNYNFFASRSATMY